LLRDAPSLEEIVPRELHGIEAAKQNRHGNRDALMFLLAYRHGRRAKEVVELRWEQIDFKGARLHVRRAKNGTPATHPLTAGALSGPSLVAGTGRHGRRRRLLLGFSATIASVVIKRPAINAQSCSATRTTLVGSMIPLLTR
jgi:integrase